MVDWVVTNPPYSILDKIFKKLVTICNKGFTLLLSIHNITPKRIDEIEKAGFGIRLMHMVRVKRWFGFHVIVVWERNCSSTTVFIALCPTLTQINHVPAPRVLLDSTLTLVSLNVCRPFKF